MSEHTKGELPKRLQAIIMDSETVFLVRIGTDPRTTDTGIANIIPQGLDRSNRDIAIQIARRLIHCWNNLDSVEQQRGELRDACEDFMRFANKDIPKGVTIPETWLNELKIETGKIEEALSKVKPNQPAQVQK